MQVIDGPDPRRLRVRIFVAAQQEVGLAGDPLVHGAGAGRVGGVIALRQNLVFAPERLEADIHAWLDTQSALLAVEAVQTVQVGPLGAILLWYWERVGSPRPPPDDVHEPRATKIRGAR